jgi:hypothetical protein
VKVPFPVTTTTPTEQNEYEDLNSFLTDRTGVDIKKCDPEKIDRLRDKWDLENGKPVLEMQLALYYALNPQLYPIEGFIGVSEKCCWTCDFVLRYVLLSTAS